MKRGTLQSGFTLVELLVVVFILGLLAALVAPNLIGAGTKQNPKIAKTQIEMLRTALDSFRLDVGRYPNSQEGLQALLERPAGVERWDGPYLREGKGVPKDPWQNPYVYRSPGERGAFDLFSYGEDGTAGGDGLKADVF
ncbi:MAG: type II secretion system protein GspG [Deltaproteobacteria bacterium]|nr:type II secretion system protein GspG [Deltaproteobacteria bacterium]